MKQLPSFIFSPMKDAKTKDRAVETLNVYHESMASGGMAGKKCAEAVAAGVVAAFVDTLLFCEHAEVMS